MRAALGFAGIHAVVGAVGMALLYALGLVSRRRHALAAAGPAYLCGLAALMPVLILLLVIGVPVRLPTLLATALALVVAFAAAGAVFARRNARPQPSGPDEGRAARWATLAGAAALGVFFVFGATALDKLPPGGDAWGMWSHKALALFYFDGSIESDVLAGGAQGPAQLGYPILQPLLESLFFRAMGGVYLQEWTAALWIIFGCFVWTAGYLLHTRGLATVATLAPLAALALTPASLQLVSIGYADVTVACFAAAGALSIGLWLGDGRWSYGVLGGVFLAAAANTKNEGAAAAALVLLAAGVALAFTDRSRWRGWLAASVIVAASAAPWAIWRSSKGLENVETLPLSEVLTWSFLTGRADRVGTALGELLGQLADQGAWMWLVPSLLALAIVCIATGTARPQASFYVAAVTLMLLALVWVYWTARRDVEEFLSFSADRVVAGAVFVSAVGVMHLLGMLLPRPGQRPSQGVSPKANEGDEPDLGDQSLDDLAADVETAVELAEKQEDAQ